MTHSLHRSGSVESLRGDYVWFMYQSKGINDQNIASKAVEFIAAAEAVGSENWGDVKSGCILEIPVEDIRARVTDKSRLRGVFTRREQVVEFLEIMKEKDTGLSIVITGLLDEVLPACKEAGVTPHTVNYSLGVWGKKELLPTEDVLAVTTMCGHHQVAPNFVEKMADEVRRGRKTPEEAARELALYCPCGIFNQVRAAKLLEEQAKPQV
ncbi:MAG TPA: hypothetical protein VFD42_00460 [Chloroflexota bacterium]|nr:hypothetical protein [Chloroflexota bacterium]